MKKYILDPNKTFTGKPPLWPSKQRPGTGVTEPDVDDYALHDEDLVMDQRIGVDPVEERAIWEDMLQELDFQKGVWYLWDTDNEQWQEIEDDRAVTVLRSYGFSDPADRKFITRMFRDRSRNSSRIKHEEGEDMGWPFDPERLAAMKPPPETLLQPDFL
jgi:hypothetical protein